MIVCVLLVSDSRGTWSWQLASHDRNVSDKQVTSGQHTGARMDSE